jgi:hypothetical protein
MPFQQYNVFNNLSVFEKSKPRHQDHTKTEYSPKYIYLLTKKLFIVFTFLRRYFLRRFTFFHGR